MDAATDAFGFSAVIVTALSPNFSPFDLVKFQLDIYC